MGSEFEFVMSISERLKAGQWIAVVDKDIITGSNAKEVFNKIKRRYPKNEPFIMKIPENANMLL